MQTLRRAQVSINLDALRHNLQQAKTAAPDSKVMAVIKANAYGHGIKRVAHALDQADGFAVATMMEAVALRQEAVSKTLLVLQGVSCREEIRQAVEHQITVSVHHQSQLQLFRDVADKLPAVWLKLDTGMHRLGFHYEQAAELFTELETQLTGVMMHFANADDPDNPANQQQLIAFTQVTSSIELPRSVANSAALLSRPDSQFEWVRPGIMLYGSSPLLQTSADSLNLRPAMTLSAPLVAINKHRTGDAIGYGGDYICTEDMNIGVVAVGYGDGYPRHAPSGTPVLLRGCECPLAGRVSMDMLTVDLSRCPEAEVGDEVILWGEELSVDKVAEYAGTIGYELLCAAGRYS